MRAVVQRVISSEVWVNGEIVGKIGKGINVLIGVEEEDTIDDVNYTAEKIANLRIFEDENEKLNLSLLDIGGQMLVVSQFTLLGDCRKGRRPNFMTAAKPHKAVELYDLFANCCKDMGIKVETGVFQAQMLVKINNDGPVTILVDSNKKF